MNLRIMLTVCLLSLPVGQMYAAFGFDSIDDGAGRALACVAGFMDRMGARVKLCAPPLKDTLNTAWDHAKNLDFEAANKTLNTFDSCQNLPQAPCSRFIRDYMTEAKIALGIVLVVVAAVATKKIFFPKKSKKSKSL